MARVTTLVPRDERTGPDVEADKRPASHRQACIGRLNIDLINLDQPFARSWKRVSNVRDASYVLIFPLTGCVAYSQDGRIGIARAGEYILLSELAFYELSSDRNTRLLLVRIPATELRGRLVSIEDHISRRFEPNQQMTRLLSGMIGNIAELFIDAPPPNPQALATEIIGFVALTIGSEDRGAATDVRNARYHLRRRIIDFIEAHLSDQTLSPTKIAANSRISLSYLYSLFSDNETTVVQFVQVKRLQRAYEILVADPKGHRTVSEVAYEVGFKNVSHFSRSFSRHFKIAPRDIRQVNNAFGPEAHVKPRRLETVPASKTPPPLGGNLGSAYWETSKRPLHETV
ncbi:helix-turn-helix domain-containing protein [Bradyrhizobium sp. AUGA SZCCT0222]|uniref:helix-turn-helix domain-containing protein n=1 Tax=Bradyrhizobium sp. AUGA SZCCT0222 TaxID=2807668 RepID=UPI001BAB00DD|nr:helix-turn-helix domain-containing protein [Bradyrhizobium sp. AUGA SZCCT0222]MBR1269337.1 helix-turn-helix domain-containing protein [Bradyrhizobium sp. AUGA SZCCT0222]